MYTLLWSWQHVEAVGSMQLFCRTGQTRSNRVVKSGRRGQMDVRAVCGGLKVTCPPITLFFSVPHSAVYSTQYRDTYWWESIAILTVRSINIQIKSL